MGKGTTSSRSLIDLFGKENAGEQDHPAGTGAGYPWIYYICCRRQPVRGAGGELHGTRLCRHVVVEGLVRRDAVEIHVVHDGGILGRVFDFRDAVRGAEGVVRIDVHDALVDGRLAGVVAVGHQVHGAVVGVHDVGGAGDAGVERVGAFVSHVDCDDWKIHDAKRQRRVERDRTRAGGGRRSLPVAGFRAGKRPGF